MEITNVPGLGQKPASQTLGKRDLANRAQGAATHLAQGKRELVLPALEGAPGKGTGQRHRAGSCCHWKVRTGSTGEEQAHC